MELNEKQLQIIAVAEKLFAENGFTGTSVRNIAKEAGINIAMISYYFGSKEKLLEHLVVYRMANFKIDLLSVINKDDVDFKKRLDQLVNLFVMRIHENQRIYKIIHTELSKESGCLTFEHYINQKKENYKTLESFIIKGQQAGIFKENIEIPLIIPTLIGIYFHFNYNQEYFNQIYSIKSKRQTDSFVKTTLTKHIQTTLKALLTYEN
ncbi:TetR family transcriptional regulator [Leeuwenhoekiella aestuarii]|uniref:TetR family transcriptional regulator n=1 Tax=Leeuwenhoekiella aestuarii TaxID=2249426 RepID=A0A4Q0NVA6_9FLAO|nr:TetR family transcriptional regulator [Leeuwenhoekiella aestuarii]RXG15661.1 TetR family transcriptional regulator [Leeuwenhoekiella aestuarii]RXG17230.1 TetR family transcriptional regulator [Leeuwenhoekiella aestuarii]